MESAVSPVYFGYTGCAPLYYYSPRLVYVLFLDSLCVSTRGGAEAKCDPQMSTIPPAAPLCSADNLQSQLKNATLGPLGCHHPSPPAAPLYAEQKWPSAVWPVANTVLG